MQSQKQTSLLRPLLAILAVFGLFSASLRGGPAIHLRRWIPEEAMVRLMEDLDLSSQQREAATTLFERYTRRIDRLRAEFDQRTRARVTELMYIAAPELDDSFPIEDLPPEEQERIRTMRRRLKGGVNPLTQNEQFAKAHVAMSEEMMAAITKLEEERRREFLTSLETLLDESQLTRAPRALRRLQINMHALNPLPGVPETYLTTTDPVWRFDMIRLFEDASASDGELAFFADAFSELGEIDDIEVRKMAQLVGEFEIQYAAQIELFETNYSTWKYRRMRAWNDGQHARAKELLDRERERRHSIFRARTDLATRIGVIAGELLGEAAETEWFLRFRSALCPVAYMPDSTEWLHRRLRTLELEQAQVDALEELFEQYARERKVLRERAMNAEIAEYCSPKTPLKDRPLLPEERALRRVHDQRVLLADRTNQQMRAVLGLEDQEQFDGWLGRFRAETAQSSEPRP